MGALIKIAEKNSLLEKLVPILSEIKDQRNYFTHNIHALFVGLIDETILPKNDLIDLDIESYISKAEQLDKNLSGLADIMEKYNEHT